MKELMNLTPLEKQFFIASMGVTAEENAAILKGVEKLARGINVLLTLVDKFSAPITAVAGKTNRLNGNLKTRRTL